MSHNSRRARIARIAIVAAIALTIVLTGRNAKVWTCAVTYGFGAASLKVTPPDLLLEDLRELPPLLRGRAS